MEKERAEKEFVSDDELILEDEIETLLKPARKQTNRACANCTCGKKEKEIQNKNTPTDTSACGKCYLGDAFRCSSCPYTGLPPFKPNEVIQFDDDI
ncbi:hypothetical protein NEOKW01_0612 [Nematocida sp. AWRm80]|nr:hypothetical protein NEOKW01_0612 [Nematocida sp. AWRm80]